MKVKQIQHVNLIVSDLEKCREFYTNVMGLEELPALKFDYPVQFYKLNESQELHLSEWEDTTSFRAHLCFEVEDFNAAFFKFKELGVIDIKPWGKARKLTNGKMQMFVRDPSGNLLEITHYDTGDVAPEIFEDELFEASSVFVSGRNDSRGLR